MKRTEKNTQRINVCFVICYVCSENWNTKHSTCFAKHIRSLFIVLVQRSSQLSSFKCFHIEMLCSSHRRYLKYRLSIFFSILFPFLFYISGSSYPPQAHPLPSLHSNLTNSSAKLLIQLWGRQISTHFRYISSMVSCICHMRRGKRIRWTAYQTQCDRDRNRIHQSSNYSRFIHEYRTTDVNTEIFSTSLSSSLWPTSCPLIAISIFHLNCKVFGNKRVKNLTFYF